MKRKYTMIKKIALIILAITFTLSGISYAQQEHTLRPPVGVSKSRMLAVQSSVRLRGGVLAKEELSSFTKEFARLFRRSLKAGKVWTLFEDRRHKVEGEKDLKMYPSHSKFFEALRKQKPAGNFPEGFDVVILGSQKEKGLPIDVMLHSGHSRKQAYVAFSTIKVLEDIYNDLQDDYKPDLINAILEGFKHEATHILLRAALKNKSPPEIERTIDENAPSFRAREIFRLVYLRQRLSNPELLPDMNKFFENLGNAKNKASHLFAYTELSPEKHLEIAENLMPPYNKNVTFIDVVLAQHHVGYALATALKTPEDADSPLFKKAVRFLIDKGLINRDPETGNPYPVWKFVRELIIQNKIALLKDITRSNIILTNIEQLDPWISGTQFVPGDSLKYPKPGETIALPVTLGQAMKVIEDIPEKILDDHAKQGLIDTLKKVIVDGGKEYILVPQETLAIIGSMFPSASSTSAAGAGTRFAFVVGFDESGKPIFHDVAKGVLKLSVIDGGRSFIEIFLAQAAYNKNNTPCIIYTSHVTDEDVKEELKRIGYEQTNQKSSRYALYRHATDPHYSDVTVVRLHKTSLLDINNGDFLSNVDSEINWVDAHWPHAHDSAIIDFITSGLAYEMTNKGINYADISNVDNRAAGRDPVIIGIMALTKAPLVNEITPKPKGERGGGAPVKMKEPLFKDHTRGNLERPNMDPLFEKGLSPEQTAQFLPHKNTANFCVNIIEYVKHTFLKPEATDADAIAFLKEFYNAKDDEERKAELKFKRLEAIYRIRGEFMFIEVSKRFPAVQVGSLLGAHPWLVDTLFLEVPQGQAAGKYTRFEESKENIENLRRILSFLKRLVTEKAKDDGISTLEQEEIFALLKKYSETGKLSLADFNDAAISTEAAHAITVVISAIANFNIGQADDYLEIKNDRMGKAELIYAIKSIGAKEGRSTKILDLLKSAEYVYQIQFESLMRIRDKGERYYPAQLVPSAETRQGL